MSLSALTSLVEQSAKYAGAYNAVTRLDMSSETTELCVVLSNFGTLDILIFLACLKRLLDDTNSFPDMLIAIRVDDRGYIIISFNEMCTSPPSTTDYLFAILFTFVLVALHVFGIE
jgi:hypothetical protein